MNKKKIFSWIKIIIILYCLAGTGIYYMQEKLIFRSEVLAANHQFDFPIPFKEVNLTYNKETNINIIQFPAADSPARGVVLYFHGNWKNISWYADRAPMFTKNNYDVWMIDYPGYGKSTGEMSEKKLYDWALIFYKLARARYSKDSIILYGRSLGTCIASQLASVRNCKALILEGPYYSMSSLAFSKAPIFPMNQMLRYELPTYKHLQGVIAPITIFHGTDDKLIPFRHAEKLKPFLKKNDEFVPVKNAGHNNLMDFDLYIAKLDSILH